MSNQNKSRRMARPPYVAVGENSLGGESDASGQEAAAIAKAPPKQSRVIEMLHDEGGTSLPELIEVTGWQAHTVRSALTGLRKKGHAIERFSVDGVTRYRIVAVAAA